MIFDIFHELLKVKSYTGVLQIKCPLCDKDDLVNGTSQSYPVSL